ncbi:hypothetical protein [Neofamilia massiliensis]|uniref:hypothetical protein n=1 Tax=Neofamilia massiliensis TaxID=1673724 RepID=UPI0006BB5EF0|nr:hypothetical protein [Neofamilia massiliensis]
MKTKIIYILAGILLISGLYMTRPKTIDPENLAAIEKVRSLDGDSLYVGFEPASYPVDVNYGSVEYSFNKGEITSQDPLYPLALSAINTDDGPHIKVLPIKDFRNLLGLESKSKESLENSYIAMLAHEAFHCYQMDHGLEDDDFQEGQEEKNQAEFMEILNRLDDDQAYQDFYLNYLEGLVKYRDRGNKDLYLSAKKDLDAYVKSILDQDKYTIYRKNSAIMEVVEGSARFVENKVLDLKEEKRNGEFSRIFPKNTSKFYMAGALKVEILENQGRLKDLTFDLSKSLDDFME